MRYCPISFSFSNALFHKLIVKLCFDLENLPITKIPKVFNIIDTIINEIPSARCIVYVQIEQYNLALKRYHYSLFRSGGSMDEIGCSGTF